jgi:hypothetical protein
MNKGKPIHPEPSVGVEEQHPPPEKRRKVGEFDGHTTTSSSSRYGEIFALLCHRRKYRKPDPEFDKLVRDLCKYGSPILYSVI